MDGTGSANAPRRTQTASLSISSREASFTDANRWFEQFLHDAQIPDEAGSDLLLVFEEVVANVTTHAYRGTEGPIKITVERRTDAVVLTVCDDGPPFDLLAQPEPNLQLPVAERAVGGLGIHLIKSLCDQIRYRRRNESNILTLTKNLS